MNAYDVVILIPSLEPDERLPAYVQTLAQSGFTHIVVVNDGSKASFEPVFDAVRAVDGVIVLTHEVNKGKGIALKTGYRYIMDNIPCAGVITADSDGQHTAEDVTRLADMLGDGADGVLLGSRDFTLPDIPPKSRFGNRLTTAVFHLLYGPKLPDTQTGLRAFSSSLLPFMADVPGARYEYEMNVLMQCALQKIKLVVVPITTVYENQNEGTHFHPIRDSWRIYKLLFANFIKYLSSSLACTLLDNGLYYLFDLAAFALMPTALMAFDFNLFGIIPVSAELQIILAYTLSRLISSAVNFKLNKSLVFEVKNCKGALGRYYLLVLGVIVVSFTLLSVLSHLLGLGGDKSFLRTLLKCVIDFILFFVNYRIQRAWVFASPRISKGEKNV